MPRGWVEVSSVDQRAAVRLQLRHANAHMHAYVYAYAHLVHLWNAKVEHVAVGIVVGLTLHVQDRNRYRYTAIGAAGRGS